jgi:hypothetical protein
VNTTGEHPVIAWGYFRLEEIRRGFSDSNRFGVSGTDVIHFKASIANAESVTTCYIQ